ncbi:hypothetical protein EX895_002649 [Sporisorium graminicola]|uniref:Vacuolar protein sorting-associated protein 51 homolog n=1 Tax=Sporisorium graminicola TaxID=280036 RepID=A0A4U7KVW0_9BASI|nr:hypothetical protein EX895_002649 [Sporisorium graminicola]TKY88297.1 hypothetical protein EX895_002649 [Sporisorium graminicola]
MASASASSRTPLASRQSQSRTSDNSASSTSSPRPKQDKRRAANLLRDYYGLSSDAPAQPSAISRDNAGSDGPPGPKIDLHSLLSSNSLSVLLSKESELIVQIRELDGERQSLVYNHHHELVAASDTIRNMKLKSESLDPSLDSLKTSFETMSNLASNLEVLRKSASSTQATEPSNTTDLDPLRDLEPIVTLPETLSDLIECRVNPNGAKEHDSESRKAGLTQAEHLWGTMEPVLAAWTDAGVAGVREIAAECRSLLKDGRKAIGSSATATRSG